MIPKPPGCLGCSLAAKGIGFAPPVGPKTAPILFVGEALGATEARTGIPFSGPAGGMLDRILRRVGLGRDEQRIANIVSCQPPGDWLDGAPWEFDAVRHCRQYLDPVLQEPHQVIVALGGSATRNLLGLPRKGHIQANWHGSPIAAGGKTVISTFHPSHLQRGQHRLLGVVSYDLQVASEVAKKGWNPEGASLVVDPSPNWFEQWVEEYFKSDRDAWLAVDIETIGKGTDEGEIKDDAYEITRINFSYHPDEGVTVPWLEAYMGGIRRLLQSSAPKLFWNATYDTTGLSLAGITVSGPILDFMWAWHVLQSDLPRGLGFAAPFYSRFGPWKHLSSTDPGRYAAIDALQTTRVAYGIAGDLQRQGQWDVFYGHIVGLDAFVLRPAEDVGMAVDPSEVQKLKERLEKELLRIDSEVQQIVPEELKPEKVWKTEREKDPKALQVSRRDTVQACVACKAIEVTKSHRCEDKNLIPNLTLVETIVPRWVRRDPFNSNSPSQLLRYIEHRGHKAGKAKKSKTDTPTTDKKTLERLAKTTKDPLYKLMLQSRAVEKVHGTYVEGALKRLKAGRLHPQFTHAPSTMRLSCKGFPFHGVKTDRGVDPDKPDSPEALAAGFRKCIVPSEGCILIEADFAGIEAVETGWYSGDPDYIRLATLGVHAYLTSHLIGKPADLKWSDADLGDYFKDIKKHYKKDYDRGKRCVHGTNYGLTPIGMVDNYPEDFTRATATAVQGLYFELCPKLPKWHKEVRDRAHAQGYLGGAGDNSKYDPWHHPFAYKHWFWNVYQWNSKTGGWSLGTDAKRCIAYLPQSTAAGVLYEACLRLMDEDNPNFIGGTFHGMTPIRLLIHDSIVLDVEKRHSGRVIEALRAEMTRPIVQQAIPEAWIDALGGPLAMGSHLEVGVEIKVGTKNWLEMESVEKSVGVAGDTMAVEEEDDVA